MTALCHPDRPCTARGLCRACYQRYRKGTATHLNVIVRQYQTNKDNRVTTNERMAKERARIKSQELPEKIKRNARLLWKRYHMTLEQYMAMGERQNWKCAICLQPPKRVLNVDHCHETNTVRALLCEGCNTLVANLEKDSELVAKAREYITQHKGPLHADRRVAALASDPRDDPVTILYPDSIVWDKTQNGPYGGDVVPDK